MRKTIVAVAIGLAFAPLAYAADLQTELMATEKALRTAWGKEDGEPFKKVLTADALELVASTTPSVYVLRNGKRMQTRYQETPLD